MALDRVPFLHRIAAYLPRSHSSVSHNSFRTATTTTTNNPFVRPTILGGAKPKTLVVPDNVRELCRTLCQYAALAPRVREERLSEHEVAIADDAIEPKLRFFSFLFFSFFLKLVQSIFFRFKKIQRFK